MRSLFFRIVLWFWAAVVVLALTFTLTFTGTILATDSGVLRDRRARNAAATLFAARAAATLYQHSGRAALEDLAASGGAALRPFYLFDSTMMEVRGQTPPAAARALAQRALAEREPDVCLNDDQWTGCRVAEPHGPPMTLVIRFPKRPFLKLLLSPGEWTVLLPALVLVAGLVCYWLARYLTEPITRLRWLTGSLADGDLHVRVEDLSQFQHSEELQGLASDFNRMAQRIQTLLDQQSQFLWDISHELRTPLTRIALAAGLTRQRLSGPVPEEFARIDRELERVNDLIGRVLTMARLESGAALDHTEVVDLPPLIDEVARDAALEADACGVTIRVRTDRVGEPARVTGTRELLRIAVENVVRNALRHSPRRSVVTLDMERQARTAAVIIRDQGPGVGEADLPRLFDPFFRTADARAQHPDGTGLGLAMTRRIVERHGGTVAAGKNDGGGLVITVTLPLLS